MINYDTTNYSDMKPFLAPDNDNLTPRQKEYRSYLATPKWHGKRMKRIVEYDNYTCQGCGKRFEGGRGLEVHHIDYRHKGDELVGDDLVSLCRRCHCIIHNAMNRKKGNGKRGWSDEMDVSMISFTEGDDDETERN